MFLSLRQLALKALNERLSKVETPASWPTMDEDGAKSGQAESPAEKHVVQKSETVPPVKLPVPTFTHPDGKAPESM